MDKPRQVFRNELKSFRNFQHPRVSELEVDDELISFKFTPETSAGSPPREGVDVALFLQNSPEETVVCIGSAPEIKYHRKSLQEVVESVLNTLASRSDTFEKSPCGVPVSAAAATDDDDYDDDATKEESDEQTDLLGPEEQTGRSPPVVHGALLRDSKGVEHEVNEELKYDIETFWDAFGKDALVVTLFEDEIVMMIDLGVSDVIGQATMMAWNLDSKKRVYALLKTSSMYYREGRPQKITVHQGQNLNEKFESQFQLTNIINRFVSATWAKDSPPFESPADHKFYGNDEAVLSAAARKLKPGEVLISKNLLAMLDMGFRFALAKKALRMSKDDLDTAIAICCDAGDSLDVSDMLTPELDLEMEAILNGSAVVDDSPPQRPPEGKKKSYLVEIVRYMQSRIPKLNEQCIICDKDHLMNVMLKPTVCMRELCSWAYQELGVASSATKNQGTDMDVVNLLVNFAKNAAKSARRQLVFDPYPLVFDPKDRKKKVLDPMRKDYDSAERLICLLPDRIGSDIRNATSLQDTLSAISPYAAPLLHWIISSNRSYFAKLRGSLVIPELGGEQFLMLSSPPEKEQVFCSLRKQHGSVFAFHGSSIENWHSIVRNGLRNASGTALEVHGKTYGRGIYMSTLLGESASYVGYSVSVATVVAVCEVINNGIKNPTSTIRTMEAESYVTTRMLLVYRNRASVPDVMSNDKLAAKIRGVMRHFNVATD